MRISKKIVLAIALSLIVSPGIVLAEPGGGHGKPHDSGRDERFDSRGDRHRPDDRHGRGEERHADVRVDFRFDDHGRDVVREYYGQRRDRACPPGLVKKGHQCISRYARRWEMGRPLPRGVVFYEVPHELVVRMPPPPPGHRYVRVAGDILLIAVGSSMVVDAVQDILN